MEDFKIYIFAIWKISKYLSTLTPLDQILSSKIVQAKHLNSSKQQLCMFGIVNDDSSFMFDRI
jgi:hypothetical protein